MIEEEKIAKPEKKESKGKRPKSKSKHAFVELWKHYKAGKFSGKWCPRCGPGTILAQHSNRTTCGKCHYSEMQKK